MTVGEDIQLLLGASLAWFSVFLAASIAAAGLYRVFRMLATLTPPAGRGGVLMLYGLQPFVVATLVVCMLNFAALYSWLLPEHCHNGLCAPHAPEFAAPAAQAALGGATALLGLLALAWFAATHIFKRLRQSRVARHLAEPGRGYRLIDSNRPAAWCDGLCFPTVYVSRGLLETLNESELRIVLAHEHAHARRRDNLSRLILDWVTWFWPAAARRSLRADFRLAAEQACDAEAALLAGNEQPVSELIARFETTSNESAAPAPLMLGERISELRISPAYSDGAALAPWAALLVLWLVSVFLFTLAAHPLLEWLSA